MVRIMFFLVFWAIFMKPILAQSTWIRTYGGAGGEEGFDVQQTTDGGYIIVGRTSSFGAGAGDMYLIKSDSIGNMLWSRTFGGSESDCGFGVIQMDDLGYAVVGCTIFGDPLKSALYIVKTNMDGDTLWTRRYYERINPVGRAIQQTKDGGLIATGYSGTGSILVKTNPIGDTLWTNIFDVNDIYKSYSIQQTNDLGYILTGVGRRDVALVKTDSLGKRLWSKHFGEDLLDCGYSVQQCLDGGYIITGIHYIPGGFESSSNIYLIKTDASGDALWMRKLGNEGSAGNSVSQTEDGGYIITGYNRVSDEYRINIIKTDSLGFPVWEKIFWGGEGNAVRQTHDGGYIVAGTWNTQISGKIQEIVLIKTDGLGNTTGINNNLNSNIITNYKLHQNHPNPFNQSTSITYEVYGNGRNVSLIIYDLLGKEVMKYFKKQQSQGRYRIVWNGRDYEGRELPSGIYFYRLENADGNIVLGHKMLLVK